MTDGSLPVVVGPDGSEAAMVAEDAVTQIYRHLESTYGDALGLGLTTIEELETHTNKRVGLVTLRFPRALGGFF